MFVKIGNSIVNASNVNYFFVSPTSDDFSQLIVNYQNGDSVVVLVGTHAEVKEATDLLAKFLPYFLDSQNSPLQGQNIADDLPF